MPTKLTTEQFIRRAKEIHGDLYNYEKSVYDGSEKKLIIICKFHQQEFLQTPHEHIGKDRCGCPRCGVERSSKKRSVGTAKFIDRAKKVHGDRYDFSLVEYKNKYTKLKIICPIHGVFETTSGNFLNVAGCPKCKGLYKTEDEVIKLFRDVHGDRYDYDKLNYINTNTPLTIGCRVCNSYFKQSYHSHLKGGGCKKCATKRTTEGQRNTTENFIKESKKVHGVDRYDYSESIYPKNNQTKLIVICVSHGKFNITPNAHLRGGGCPKCKSSKGENIIRNFLIDNNVVTKEQHRFDSCRLQRRLRFDFYLPNHNMCIEFDGVQHFKPSSFGSDRSKETKLKNLELIQHRDRIKTKYCEDHGIRLLRIPYTDKDRIPKILAEALNLGNRLTSSPGSASMTESFLDLFN